jgi:photosynthetic reaction center cytochrome c subunit
MKTYIPHWRFVVAIAAIGAAGLLASCREDGSSAAGTTSTQSGYRGTGMVQIARTSTIDSLKAKNVSPPPEDPADPDGRPAKEAYQNIQVLGDLNENDVLRLMASMTTWVSPEQGCNYCHNPENLADDSIYAKKVARHMIQMVRSINSQWGNHVGMTGVTCYTCHRGKPVPEYVWYGDPGPKQALGMARDREGRGLASATVGESSLPSDPLTPLLTNPDAIRVVAKQPLVTSYNPTTMQTETTYGLMIYMSESLGVNCTFCHNTRAISSWPQSNPQRVTAWYGLRMVSAVNKDYLDTVKGLLPASHLSPDGNGPKVGCETCHQGVSKPLLGVSLAKDYVKELGPIAGPGAPAKP